MKLKSYAILLFSMILSTAVSYGSRWELPDAELKSLNSAIAQAKEYESINNEKLDSIKTKLYSVSLLDNVRRYSLAMQLCEQYRPINPDSSMKYARMAFAEAEEMHDGDRMYYSSLGKVNAFSTAGLFFEALPDYDTLRYYANTREKKIELWKTGRLLYSYFKSYTEGHKSYYDSANRKYQAVDDSLLMYLDKKSNLYKFISCERMVTRGQYDAAKEELEALLSKLSESDNLYGMAAFQLAEVYKHKGEQTDYAAYLAKSAKSDIICSVKEGIALPALADWLYDQGELNDAFKYINFALEDAKAGNARMRTINIAAHVPHIDEAYRERINKSRDELMGYLVVVTVLMVMFLYLVFVLRKQIAKSRAAQQELAKTSKLQENYIGSFIGLCSSYADRLDTLCKLVDRKISAGQTQELVKLVKSGKFAESEDEDFYKIVDNAFLHLYPDFVEKVNELLKDDEKIELQSKDALTPELRIYAFVKLGVTESTRIAQILHYSVSTVYSYRNRMRNRAINRQDFDSDIMRIGSEKVL